MKPKTRQNSPCLYVVGTPIGHLSDLTFRAAETLKQVQVWLVEDTRRAQSLKTHLGATAKLVRFDDALSAEKRKSEILQWFQEGHSVALLSDAGTPGVNDPGALAVSEALLFGAKVVPIPGVSAVTTLWSVLGFAVHELLFIGYIPRKKNEIENSLARLFRLNQQTVFLGFESPHRILSTLEVIRQFSDARKCECQIVVAKEMTKIYETFFRGTAQDVELEVKEHLELQGEVGEWVIAFTFNPFNKSSAKINAKKNAKKNAESGMEISSELSSEFSENEFATEKHKLLKPILEAVIKGGVKPSVAARWISQVFGEERKSVYQMAIDLKEK